MLASIERELAICEGEVKMTTSFVLVMSVPLRFEMTTPGIARKPTLAASITVDFVVATT